MNFLLIEISQSSRGRICDTLLCSSACFLIIIRGSDRCLVIFRRYILIWLLWRSLYQIGLIFRDLWWSFLQRGFLRRNHRIRTWLWAWSRVWIRIRNFLRMISPNHIPCQRRLLQGFNTRENLCRRIRLHRVLIGWRSSILLMKDMLESFWLGVITDNSCQACVEFCTCRTTPPFPRKGHSLGYYHGKKFSWIILLDLFPRREEDSNMPFPVPDGSVKFLSTFEYRHDLQNWRRQVSPPGE